MEAGREQKSTKIDTRLEELQALVLSNAPLAEVLLQEFLAEAKEQGDETQAAHALAMLVGCALFQGHNLTMLAHAEEGLRLSRSNHLPALEARALSSIGLANQRLGDLSSAMHHLLESFKVAEQCADHEGICRALVNLAMVHEALGEYETSLALHEQALDAARACGVEMFIGDAWSDPQNADRGARDVAPVSP